MKVFVYRNLRNKCWSIRAEEGPAKGKVIAHASNFCVSPATLKVSEAGRQRVIREKSKNVHAGVRGHLVSFTSINGELPIDSLVQSKHNTLPYSLPGLHTKEITYNPYRFHTFVTTLGYTPVLAAEVVYAVGGRVYVEQPQS